MLSADVSHADVPHVDVRFVLVIRVTRFYHRSWGTRSVLIRITDFRSLAVSQERKKRKREGNKDSLSFLHFFTSYAIYSIYSASCFSSHISISRSISFAGTDFGSCVSAF